jgi:hypothetical protein
VASTAVVVAADLLLRTRLQESALAAGVEPELHRSVPAPPDDPPIVLLVDLDLPGVLTGLAAWRERWPQVRIVGFASHVDTDRRRAAQSLGCEVHARSATARKDPTLFLPGAG